MFTCPKGHLSQAGDYCDECGTPIGGARATAGEPDEFNSAVTTADPAIWGNSQGSRGASVPATSVPVQSGPVQSVPAPSVPISVPAPSVPAQSVSAPSGAGTSSPAASVPTAGGHPATATPETYGSPCPDCGTPQTGRFCEVCGHDFLLRGVPGVAAPAAGPSTGEGAALDAGPTTIDRSGLPQRTASTPVSWMVIATADAAYYARMQAKAEPDADPIALPDVVPTRTFRELPAQALIGRRSRSRGIEPEIDLSGPPLDPAVSHAHAMLVTHADGGIVVVDLDSSNGTYVNDEDDPIPPRVPRALASGDRVHVGAFTTLTLHTPD